MKKLILVVILFCIGWFGLRAQQQIPIATGEKLTVGHLALSAKSLQLLCDTLLLLQVDVEPTIDMASCDLPIDDDAYMQTGNVRCRLLTRTALKQGTLMPSDLEQQGRHAWGNLKRGETYSMMLLLAGQLPKDAQKLYLKNIGVGASRQQLTISVAADAQQHDYQLAQLEGKLVLADLATKKGGMVEVIDIAHAQPKWVAEALLTQTIAVRAPERNNLLQLRDRGPQQAARIEVVNTTRNKIKVTLGTQTFTLRGQKHRMVDVPAGTLWYVAQPQGSIPQVGMQDILPGHDYRWEFMIVTLI